MALPLLPVQMKSLGEQRSMATATDEGVAAAMAGAADRNTLEVLPQNGLVGGFGVEDDGVVGERLEFTGERFGIFLHHANSVAVGELREGIACAALCGDK